MSTDEQAIRDLIATWIHASKAGDNATVLTLMSDDVLFLVAGRPPMMGKAAFTAAQGAMAGDFEIDGQSEVQEVQVLGDWAYCWTQLTVTVSQKSTGSRFVRAGNTLSVLKKVDGRWVIHRDANMLAAVPQ
jgi:uncharacterized protein (TIGR02246 family)